MSPYPGGKHGPGHYIPAGGPGPPFPSSAAWEFVGIGSATIQEAQDTVGTPASMPAHDTGYLLATVCANGQAAFTPAGWTRLQNGQAVCYHKTAAGPGETFVMPALPGGGTNEAGRAAQVISYRPIGGIPSRINTGAFSDASSPDSGDFALAGLTGQPATDTLSLVAAVKAGVDYDAVDYPPIVTGIAPWTTNAGFTFLDWELHGGVLVGPAGSFRIQGLVFGLALQAIADVLPDATVSATPAAWFGSVSFPGSTSDSFAMRFDVV